LSTNYTNCTNSASSFPILFVHFAALTFNFLKFRKAFFV